MAYGHGGHIGISFQDSYGTAETGSMDYFPFISETMNETIEDLMSEGITARLDEPDDYEGMHAIEGEVVTEVHPVLIGKLLKAWCGQSSRNDFVGSCYQHIFVPLTADWDSEKSALPPCTIEVYRDTGSAYQYYDCLLNTLNIEIAQGAIVKATAGWVGANFAWMNKTSPSYEAGSYYTWDQVSVSLAATGYDEFSQLTFTLDNKLEGKAYLDGNKTYGRILRSDFRMIEVAGTVLLSGDDEVRNFRDRTQQRLIVTAYDPTTVMDGHHKLEIDVPKMKYTEYPTGIGGPQMIEVSFSGKGKYDSTSSYAVQFTLVNTKEAY